jgi:hypothetical protein
MVFSTSSLFHQGVERVVLSLPYRQTSCVRLEHGWSEANLFGVLSQRCEPISTLIWARCEGAFPLLPGSGFSVLTGRWLLAYRRRGLRKVRIRLSEHNESTDGQGAEDPDCSPEVRRRRSAGRRPEMDRQSWCKLLGTGVRVEMQCEVSLGGRSSTLAACGATPSLVLVRSGLLTEMRCRRAWGSSSTGSASKVL